ncbi:hypothetical protein, partial [Thiolapillus sp.]
MTRTAGAPIGCQRPSRFWGLGCPKIYHEAEDTLDRVERMVNASVVDEAAYRTAPEPGQLVEVRRRQWIVSDVQS